MRHTSFAITRKLLLIAAVILGNCLMFHAVPIHPVQAMTHTAAMATSSPQNMCNNGGCAQQNRACESHCVSNSTQHTVATSLNPASPDQIFADAPSVKTALVLPLETSSVRGAPDQSPSPNYFLRSVIKRE